MTNKQKLNIHEAFVKCLKVHVRHGDMKDVKDSLEGLESALKKEMGK